VDLFLCRRQNAADKNGIHEIDLEPYGYRWLRLGGADTTMERSTCAGGAG
jgi:hypothetical protein